jgi:hypothetical protein
MSGILYSAFCPSCKYLIYSGKRGAQGKYKFSCSCGCEFVLKVEFARKV